MGKTTEQMRKKVRKARPLKKAEKNLRKKAKTLEKAAEDSDEEDEEEGQEGSEEAGEDSEEDEDDDREGSEQSEDDGNGDDFDEYEEEYSSTPGQSMEREKILMILPILILIHRKAETTATERAAEAESRTETIRSSQMRKEPQEKTTRPEKA